MSGPILIVEDDKRIQELVSKILAHEGYEVIIASNGEIALDTIKQSNPALVILDLRLPVMDGWEFLNRYCRQTEETAPIVALSAHLGNPALLPCVNAFIPKPFDLNTLLNVVQRYVKL
jgi:DNA-binding response OmpR family regulator